MVGDRDSPGVRLGGSLAIYLVVKGFKPSPITAGMTADTTPVAHREFAA